MKFLIVFCVITLSPLLINGKRVSTNYGGSASIRNTQFSDYHGLYEPKEEQVISGSKYSKISGNKFGGLGYTSSKLNNYGSGIDDSLYNVQPQKFPSLTSSNSKYSFKPSKEIPSYLSPNTDDYKLGSSVDFLGGQTVSTKFSVNHPISSGSFYSNPLSSFDSDYKSVTGKPSYNFNFDSDSGKPSYSFGSSLSSGNLHIDSSDIFSDFLPISPTYTFSQDSGLNSGYKTSFSKTPQQSNYPFASPDPTLFKQNFKLKDVPNLYPSDEHLFTEDEFNKLVAQSNYKNEELFNTKPGGQHKGQQLFKVPSHEFTPIEEIHEDVDKRPSKTGQRQKQNSRPVQGAGSRRKPVRQTAPGGSRARKPSQQTQQGQAGHKPYVILSVRH